jgi:hypothetical protein
LHGVEKKSEVHPACYKMVTSEPEEWRSQGGLWHRNITIAVSSAFAKHVFVVLLSALYNFFIRRQMITKVFVFRKGDWSNFIKSNFFIGTTDPSGPGTPHCGGFTIKLRHATVGRTPLDE